MLFSAHSFAHFGWLVLSLIEFARCSELSCEVELAGDRLRAEKAARRLAMLTDRAQQK